MSIEVFEAFYDFIVPTTKENLYRGLSWVTPEEAAVDLESGRSHQPPPEMLKRGLRSSLGYVSNPDWHTPSWLWKDEMQKVVPDEVVTENRSFQVVMDVLDSIERALTDRPRIVFWFDN